MIVSVNIKNHSSDMYTKKIIYGILAYVLVGMMNI